MVTLSEMLEEYRHPDLYNASSHFLELDFFFPKLKLAVEYQVFGCHGYFVMPFRDFNITKLWNSYTM
jgi:hypothetical protein